MTHFLFDFWNLRQILGLLDVKCLYRSSTVFALAVLIGRPSNRAQNPNFSNIFVHLSRKSWVIRLFEPSCIYEPYNLITKKLLPGNRYNYLISDYYQHNQKCLITLLIRQSRHEIFWTWKTLIIFLILMIRTNQDTFWIVIS